MVHRPVPACVSREEVHSGEDSRRVRRARTAATRPPTPPGPVHRRSRRGTDLRRNASAASWSPLASRLATTRSKIVRRRLPMTRWLPCSKRRGTGLFTVLRRHKRGRQRQRLQHLGVHRLPERMKTERRDRKAAAEGRDRGSGVGPRACCRGPPRVIEGARAAPRRARTPGRSAPARIPPATRPPPRDAARRGTPPAPLPRPSAPVAAPRFP